MRTAFIGLALLWAAPISAEEQVVRAELIAEHASIQLGGTTRVGIHFDIEEGWHIYAKDPGDAGLPTTVTWSGPDGATFGALQWPAPHQLADPGDIRTFGYSGMAVLWSQLSLRPDRPAGTIPIRAAVTWLACKALCVPGSATLSLTLPVSPARPVVSPHAHLFDTVPG